MRDLLDAVLQALECGERVALITTVRSVGSTPRHNAAHLVVFPDGNTLGSIGGGTMELQAVADARTALAQNKPLLVEYSLTGRGEGNLGLCGGTQEVFIDVLDRAALGPFRAIRRALDEGEPAVLAVVVRSDSPTLARGTRQLVRLQGESEPPGASWQQVVDAARDAMAAHYPSRIGFDPQTGASHRLLSTRRAPVEVFLDLYDPRPRLLILGAGHIGVALARQARFLNWQVDVIDDRADFLTSQNLPDTDSVYLAGYDPGTEQLAPLSVSVTAGTAVVVATWGWDEPALRQLAGVPAFYVGLVASLRKATVILEQLRTEGVDPDWLNRVRVPVGLDLGAESPEEIALAIMAEILATARGKTGLPLQEVRGSRILARAGV